MNETSKLLKKWEIRKEKEQRTVILATPMTALAIFKKP